MVARVSKKMLIVCTPNDSQRKQSKIILETGNYVAIDIVCSKLFLKGYWKPLKSKLLHAISSYLLGDEVINASWILWAPKAH